MNTNDIVDILTIEDHVLVTIEDKDGHLCGHMWAKTARLIYSESWMSHTFKYSMHNGEANEAEFTAHPSNR